MKTEELPDFLKAERLRKLPFLVPEGYFNELSNSVSERLKLEQTSENEDFSLGSQEYNWQVPEGYFDTLPGKIWSRIDQEATQKETKVISLWGNWKVWSAAASVFVLLLAGLIFFLNPNKSIETENMALAPEEIERYLLETQWRVQPDVQIWLAGNDTQTPAADWIEEIDQETIEKQLENYDDELFTN